MRQADEERACVGAHAPAHASVRVASRALRGTRGANEPLTTFFAGAMPSFALEDVSRVPDFCRTRCENQTLEDTTGIGELKTM